MSSPSPRVAGRIASLDGLRGLAATIVLLHHWLLIARPLLEGSLSWAIISQSPVKLLTAGNEAVLVFFVLSGLVVVLPVFRPGFSWMGFLSARIVRLYGPVIAALALSVALIYLVPRDRSTMPEGSWMAETHATDVTWQSFLFQASLVPRQYPLNNPLWSLHWELLYSILLPFATALALLVRRWALTAVVVCCAISLVGRVFEQSELLYFPIFLIGTIMAARMPDLLAWVERPRARWFMPTFAAASVVMLIASWLARPIAPSGSELSHVLWALAAPGAAGIVVVSLAWAPAIRFLETRPLQWLGKISFSLYLVHVPVLATLAFALGSDQWPLIGIIGIPLSLLVAWAFYQAVEARIHQAARRVHRAVAARANRRAGEVAP
ncbi:MAG: acyltransferase [Candidatus Microbacterium phytovorans]|uniref:Acyltransferase n=1 Tax=Candidatus Microbacterium phytovorans TaxID=3121374 RepID=A0AAJ5W5K5_9MICO|nr:acyltransferase [Microbacterium sp.]WEK14655.1 MAG: acyltransferase [Microbacterium sp.]